MNAVQRMNVTEVENCTFLSPLGHARDSGMVAANPLGYAMTRIPSMAQSHHLQLLPFRKVPAAGPPLGLHALPSRTALCAVVH